MNVEAIARVCHEVNRAYSQALGDNSIMPWRECPEWMKNTVITGVKFHIENPKAGPSASHERWVEEKVASGWKYGAVKDAEKKEHPCIVAFNQLSVEDRAKDFIFWRIVRTLHGVVDEE